MEKILVDSRGSITKFNTETNSVTKWAEMFSTSKLLDICKVREDSQVITEDEVINVKAGQIVITFSTWSRKLEKHISKVIVISDLTAAYDIDQIEEFVKEHNKKNEIS